MNVKSPPPRIGHVLRSYPRLSQTFVLDEIRALEGRGIEVEIFAVVNPQESIVQPHVAAVRAPVHYLDTAERGRAAKAAMHLPVIRAAPGRYAAILFEVLRRRELDEGYTAAPRIKVFAQAVRLAGLLESRRSTGRPISHLHAHFAHDPTLIVWLVHRMTGVPYSFTAHARDLYQVPIAALVERVRDARAVITCCGANLDYLRWVVPETWHPKIRLVRHGVDVEEFRPPTKKVHPGEPLVLSAGRLVEKKGFADLLNALHLVKRSGRRFRCEILGDGPMQETLRSLIARLGLEREVALTGTFDRPHLRSACHRAAVFALTPHVAVDGDRDGIPNVMAEAMACGLPVVATAVAGVPELVTHGRDGWLITPRDTEGIAASLITLLDDEALRRKFGAAARRTVVTRFDLRASAAQLAALFNGARRSMP